MRKRNHLKTDHRPHRTLKKYLLIGGALLVVLSFLSSIIFGEMGFVKYFRMKTQYSALNSEIAKLRSENAKLLRDVHALRTDPAYLERLARDKLGLARPGEIVYYYGEP